eukprot:CAMPEP_0185562820 /NCGR_PEP_ID=MMETSP1381-20130426/62212_1 /TAXON_ID=298111 /ORGANISM="Pavlova sp., Strain CCMP459" /LENGTH=128 /DNA_ID=CAMNT_0028176669 /DNA_START=184 /DNA_END=567 /DNA_ORIENTATION=-
MTATVLRPSIDLGLYLALHLGCYSSLQVLPYPKNRAEPQAADGHTEDREEHPDGHPIAEGELQVPVDKLENTCGKAHSHRDDENNGHHSPLHFSGRPVVHAGNLLLQHAPAYSLSLIKVDNDGGHESS